MFTLRLPLSDKGSDHLRFDCLPHFCYHVITEYVHTLKEVWKSILGERYLSLRNVAPRPSGKPPHVVRGGGTGGNLPLYLQSTSCLCDLAGGRSVALSPHCLGTSVSTAVAEGGLGVSLCERIRLPLRPSQVRGSDQRQFVVEWKTGRPVSRPGGGLAVSL